MTEYKKKLIEVALPLDAINAESAREKSIRHGHPSTLHLWWARRPLAACRAVLFAQLVDDPSAHPEEFPDEESQDNERARLFSIIEQLVRWENVTNAGVLELARAEIRKSYGGTPPPVLDPFAGGGSIPLEAQRLGLEVHASDLNPVAVLINKALIEIPSRWSGFAPLFPGASAERTRWNGAEGLAEDVRRYGRWIVDQAAESLGDFYPNTTDAEGRALPVIAWIWARTISCPNPACGATMPLARSYWLSKRKGNETFLVPRVDGHRVTFDLVRGRGTPPESPKVSKRGADFRCLVCGEVAEASIVRESLRGSLNRYQLLATAVDAPEGRRFIAGGEISQDEVELEGSIPQLSTNSRHMGGATYGLHDADVFYTARQKRLMSTMVRLIQDVGVLIRQHLAATPDDGVAGPSYVDDLVTLLGLSVSKMARFHTTLSTWRPDEQKFSRAFGGTAMEMTWDFAEANPFGGSGGDVTGLFDGTADAVLRLRGDVVGTASQDDATTRNVVPGAVVCTDPPYYDNVPYSDLSDHFYFWLRRALAEIHPELLSTIATPKSAEIVADPTRSGGRANAEVSFRSRLQEFFENMQSLSDPSTPACVYYAFKQSEKIKTSEDLFASTGWAQMLEGLVAARWQIVATWPLLTEGKTRRRGQGSNALLSSIVLVCRPRSVEAGITDRQGLRRALQAELPGPLAELQKASIAPVDLRQAAIGPGMAVFSRFAKVIESDSEPMRVRTALAMINQVLDGILSEQESDFDTETRWAIQWFQQFYFDEGPYGVAEQLATAMNVSVAEMERSGILTSGNGKVRLLGRDEYTSDWDPRKDPRTPIWEATQHLVKRLEDGGELASAKLLELLGGVGESCRALAYRLYTICEKTRPNLAGPFNALAASWTEMQRVATDDKRRMAEPGEQQSFDVT